MEKIFAFKACIVGCGKMGEAILKSLLHKGTFATEDLIVAEANSQIGEKIKDTYKVEVCADSLQAALNSKLIILFNFVSLLVFINFFIIFLLFFVLNIH